MKRRILSNVRRSEGEIIRIGEGDYLIVKKETSTLPFYEVDVAYGGLTSMLPAPLYKYTLEKLK